MIGSTICDGRYHVVEEIGRGGMGIVYKAVDTRLNIPVAVKVLPPSSQGDEAARKRFLDEVRHLAPMDHPNVVSVRDTCSIDGFDVLVMTFVPGVTLDEALRGGPLPESEVVQFGIQLADGLAAAHSEGLIHRDVKPANLRITAQNRLKILDFGLAKKWEESSTLTDSGGVTKEHTVVGTLPYMAPERLLGHKDEPGVDIYGAGAVLYEMATGQPLYPGLHGDSLKYAILNESPKRPRAVNHEISAALERVILKAIEKDPQSRYRTAGELESDLKRIGESHPPPRLIATLSLFVALVIVVILARVLWPLLNPATAVAVLPFQDLSTDQDQEFRAAGMTEELITQLGALLTQLKIPPERVRVLGRMSVMRYRHTTEGVRQIARELGAAYVLDGSVLKAGSQLRVSAHLQRAHDEAQLWGQDYDADPSYVFAVQDSIARTIVRTILPHLLERAQGIPPPQPATASSAAHDSYLRGLYALNARTAEGLDQAVVNFKQALAADSTFALAHAGLSAAYDLMAAYGYRRPREVMPMARTEALKAVALDPALAEAHTALASVLQDYDWDWDGAEREFKRALELNRNYATAHQWYADHLASRGRLKEARTELDLASQLDPLSTIINTDLGTLLLYARRYDEAIVQFRRTLEQDTSFTAAYGPLTLALWLKGERQEAVVVMERALRYGSDPVEATRLLRGEVTASGYAGLWQFELLMLQQSTRDSSYASPFDFAKLYALKGDRARAMASLEMAYAERSASLASIAVNPVFDGIRSDPRYARLLRRMNLVQSQ